MELRHAIALTGSIGSGKSTLVSFLSLYGYKSICADEIAHLMLQKHSDEVIAAFGSDIIGDNAQIDRKKLGKIVFSANDKRKQLQDILHPYITECLLNIAKILEQKRAWYFLDIPLFFEVGGKDIFPVSRSLVVYTPAKKAIERVMCRDNLSYEEAKARLDSQIPIEKKCILADDIIGNDGSLRALQQRVESYLRSLPPL